VKPNLAWARCGAPTTEKALINRQTIYAVSPLWVGRIGQLVELWLLVYNWPVSLFGRLESLAHIGYNKSTKVMS